MSSDDLGIQGEEQISLDKVPKLYLVCEGFRTEPQYISLFLQKHRECANYYPAPIGKTGFDTHLTDRTKMADLAKGEKLFLSGKLTLFKLITIVLRELESEIQKKYGISDNYKKMNDKQKQLVSILNQIREQSRKACVTDKRLNMFLDKDEIILMKKEKLFVSAIEKQIDFFFKNNNELKISFKFNKFDKISPTNGYRKGDSALFVFDRDYDPKHPNNNSMDKYRKCIVEVKNAGWKPLLSTPFFEFWLLLHFDNVDFSDITTNLDSKYPIFKQILEKEGQNISNMSNEEVIEYYEKTHKNLQDYFDDWYADSFEKALSTSIMDPFVTDPMLLIHRVGTNVGKELNSLVKKN